MTFSAYASGTTQVGETSYMLRHRLTPLNGTHHGIILLHGHGGNSLQFVNWPTGQGDEAHALAEAGFIALGIDAGGPNNWSSPASMTAISSAYTWLTANGAAPGRVGLMAWSMGALCALNWLKRNPSLVAGAWLWAPVTDLTWAYGVSGWAAEIDAAHGSFAATAGYRVADEPQSYAATRPIRIAHAVDDSVVPFSQSTSFIAATHNPALSLRTVPSGDHTGLFDQVPNTEGPAFFSDLSY